MNSIIVAFAIGSNVMMADNLQLYADSLSKTINLQSYVDSLSEITNEESANVPQAETQCIIPDIYPCENPNEDYSAIIKDFSQEELDSIARSNWILVRSQTEYDSISKVWPFSQWLAKDSSLHDSCLSFFEYTIRGGSEFSKESSFGETQEYSCRAVAKGNASVDMRINTNFTWHGSYYNHLKINRVFNEGLLNRVSKIYNGSGTLIQVVAYKNGLRNGEEKIYSPDGYLKRVRFFEDGKLEGSAIAYDKYGNKVVETLYKNGKKESSKEYGNYSESSKGVMGLGCVASKVPLFGCSFECHKEIQRECDCLEKYEGKIFITKQTLYENGERKKLETTYYWPCHRDVKGTKKKSKEFTYENGLLNGMVKEFYPNGKIKSTILYENGEAISEKKCFSKKGKIQKTGTEKMKCD